MHRYANVNAGTRLGAFLQANRILSGTPTGCGRYTADLARARSTLVRARTSVIRAPQIGATDAAATVATRRGIRILVCYFVVLLVAGFLGIAARTSAVAEPLSGAPHLRLAGHGFENGENPDPIGRRAGGDRWFVLVQNPSSDRQRGRLVFSLAAGVEIHRVEQIVSRGITPKVKPLSCLRKGDDRAVCKLRSVAAQSTVSVDLQVDTNGRGKYGTIGVSAVSLIQNGARLGGAAFKVRFLGIAHLLTRARLLPRARGADADVRRVLLSVTNAGPRPAYDLNVSVSIGESRRYFRLGRLRQFAPRGGSQLRIGPTYIAWEPASPTFKTTGASLPSGRSARAVLRVRAVSPTSPATLRVIAGSRAGDLRCARAGATSCQDEAKIGLRRREFNS